MDTAKVVRLHALGGPEVLQLEELPLQQPVAGEVRLKVQAVALNRAEEMFRTGHYLELPEFPSRIGIEAAGIVDAVGSGVTQVKIGQKVSVATGQSIGRYGTYGQSAIIPAVSAIPYPDNLTPEEAATVWVQYLTAYFAFVDLGNVKPGQFVLVTAASGGAGLGAIQIARLLGATTIATTRTGAKKQALLDAGASHVIVTGEEDLLARIKEITKGKGLCAQLHPAYLYGLQLLRTFQSWIAAQRGGIRTRNQIYPAESGERQTEAHHRKNVPLE
jgi:NADPH:quinone reductase-like Zn-dependent oxidoreductase